MKRWSENSQLPHLKQLASKCLCIPATPASSESCFSSAGLTVSKLRTQLSGERLELIMAAWKLLNFMHCKKVLL